MVMTWRYVVSLEWGPSNEGHRAEVYAIRELYTGDDGALSWSEKSVSPIGETWLELADDVAKMGAATSSAQILDMTLDPPALVNRRDLRRKR